jgi:hypothetical protein
MPKPLDTSHICWHDYFYYDETSPTFLRWAVDLLDSRGQVTAHAQRGKIAGKKNKDRATVLLHGRRYKVHRVIWELLKGPIPFGMIVDHKDRNPLNNAIWNLRPITQAENNRNTSMRKDNSSGIAGVSKSNNGRGTSYWVARWQDVTGKSLQKRFSIAKLGEDQAFLLACEYRTKMIEELNRQGAGYTERHGT